MQPRRGPTDRDGAAHEQAVRRLAQIAQGVDDAWWDDHTRVADRQAASEATADRLLAESGPGPEPVVLPRPGRHAARRGATVALPGWSVPTLRPGHLTVVAVTVALALAVTTWWVLRDRPEPAPRGAGDLAATSGTPLEPLEPLPSSGEVGSAEGSGTVTVDVAGKVRRPGIVVLDEGARVTDALAAAGGPRRGVDLASLNLARILVDGEQVVVGGSSAVVGAPAAPPANGSGVLVNLNLAGVAELEGLPEVGPVTAAAIVAWRDEHGGFTSIDELLEVDGIGAKTLETIAPHVTV